MTNFYGLMIEVVPKDKCCGCEACAQVCQTHCIKLRVDKEGFLFPEIDLQRCVRCNRCDATCPVLQETLKSTPFAGYAYRSKDNELLKKTSSGGFFTAIAERVLTNGGVVFGAAFNAENEVEHTYVESFDELDSLRRSKYVQSRIGSSFIDCRRFLESGRLVAFCGTPCQIKGLNLFLGNKYGNLVTVDFVCHGVPSPRVFKQYLKELCEEYHENLSGVKEINFREKSAGVAYSFSFTTENGKHVESPRENLFLKGFLADLYLRKSCHFCSAKNFTSGADYTMCDFWGIESVLPSFPKCNISGVSQVYVVNDKLNLFKSNGVDAIIEPFDLMNQECQQKWLLQSVPMTREREEFFSYLSEGWTIREIVLKLCSWQYVKRIWRRFVIILSSTGKKICSKCELA